LRVRPATPAIHRWRKGAHPYSGPSQCSSLRPHPLRSNHLESYAETSAANGVETAARVVLSPRDSVIIPEWRQWDTADNKKRCLRSANVTLTARTRTLLKHECGANALPCAISVT